MTGIGQNLFHLDRDRLKRNRKREDKSMKQRRNVQEYRFISINSQRIFGLNLLAQLSLQYSMPKTLDMCRLALRIGLTMAQVRMNWSI